MRSRPREEVSEGTQRPLVKEETERERYLAILIPAGDAPGPGTPTLHSSSHWTASDCYLEPLRLQFGEGRRVQGLSKKLGRFVFTTRPQPCTCHLFGGLQIDDEYRVDPRVVSAPAGGVGWVSPAGLGRHLTWLTRLAAACQASAASLASAGCAKSRPALGFHRRALWMSTWVRV